MNSPPVSLLVLPHEAESAHWLLQIDDQRQALSAARERERRWDQERLALQDEIRRLSAKLTQTD